MFVALLAVAGCARSSGTATVPQRQPLGAASSFPIPQAIQFAVPREPQLRTPAQPPANGGTPVTAAAHPAFFSGEVALSNGVYYLQLPNGNPFGYYAYLSDPNYIYHFDLAYEYLVDANDSQGGLYLYDFASQHWWYTSRTFPFPYLYDFSLHALLYYYPDTSQAGHYTKNPRWFYNFATNQIIALPPYPVATPFSLTFTTTGSQAAQTFTASEQQYSGSFTVDASACSGIVTVANGSQPNTFTVTPVGVGTCNLTLSDTNGRNTAVGVSVATTIIVGQ